MVRLEQHGVTRQMLRLPPDAKAFIKEQAAKNFCSENSEVVRSIRERMKREAGKNEIIPA